MQQEIVTQTEMAVYGQQLAAQFVAGDIVALEGDLGAGKTTLAQQVLLALGAEGPFASPTFTLVNTYDLPVEQHGIARVHHIDLYRLESAEALQSIGWDDLVTDVHALVLVEWPERAAGKMPTTTKYVRIEEVSRQSRRITCEGF